ncbi:MAG: hypothetical protein IJ060_07090 [Oscillospiraceae bacterium]|nr:hypothetical protein [Oscillospiraceae bacterium]
MTQLREALAQYGKAAGNGSLEYFAMQIKGGQTASGRVYRVFPRDGAQGFSGLRSPLHEQLFRYFSAAVPGVQMCDSSERDTGSSLTERALIQFPMKADHAQVRAAVAQAELIPPDYRQRMLTQIDRIHETVGAPFSPLFQIGAETGSDGTLCGMKYYLTLRTDYSVRPKLNDALLRTLRTLYRIPDTAEGEAFCNMLREIEGRQYFASFTGINDGGGAAECKLYFQSALFGSKVKRQFAAQNAEIAEALSLHVLTDALLQYAAENRLWAEGIAVSFGEPDRIRLYWRELS